MPKHKPEELTLAEIIDHMSDEDAADWWKVMGVDVGGLDIAWKVYMESDDRYSNGAMKVAETIQAEYLKEHDQDRYLVSWPEHVLTPKFNSDANYQPA